MASDGPLDQLVPAALAQLLEPHRFGVLLGGILLGFLAGILPGIGGRIGLSLALPLALAFDPLSGAVFLLALHSVVHTSGSITPIAYGLPTSASEAATAIDGFKLQQRGRGSEALGASLTASSIGGVAGALVFLMAAPVVRPIITSLGAPEFLLLSLLGLSLVAALSDRQVFGGLAVGALGLLASTVGLDRLTGTPRFTFGRLELWDGFQIVAVVGGLFVVPEMLSLARAQVAPPSRRPVAAEIGQLIRGMRTALRYRMVLLRSTIIGIAVGIMPGAGSSVAAWLAYGDAARNPRHEPPVGTGSLPGVIAPEAANNAKEGGALIPTVYFGIPGSSSMAILIGGLVMLGFDPGPRFLGPDLGTAVTFAWTVVLGNLLSIPLFLLIAPVLVGMTAPRPRAIVPFALAGVVTSVLGSGNGIPVVGQFVVASLLGLILRSAGLPRAPFLLGFVLGPIAERSFGKTVELFGFAALARPGVIILGTALLVALLRLRTLGAMPRADESFSPTAAAGAYAGMILVALAAILAANSYDGTAWMAPVAASGLVLAAAIAALVRLPARELTKQPEFDSRTGAAFVVLLILLPIVGLVPATAAFLVIVRREIGRGSIPTLLLALAAVATAQLLFAMGLLGGEFDLGLLGSVTCYFFCSGVGP
jgi:putative tricarboxylic transport membrane protein